MVHVRGACLADALTRSVNDLAPAVIGSRAPPVHHSAMAQAGSFACLVVGAVLFGVVTRVTIPPLTWVALTLLLHASRSLAAGAALPGLWFAFYAALVVGERGILPLEGPPYFAIVAALATVMVVPFAADRLAAARLVGVRANLVFPMALVTVEFLR